MSDINDNKAWKILREDEKKALTLSLSFTKSSWEAGEIMNKSHYKYLEIKARAEKFIEIFTIHFNKYETLIPEGIVIPFHFKEYICNTIELRKTVFETIRLMEDRRYKLGIARNRLVGECLKTLRSSKDQIYIDFYNLIMDFDRWNNFRILPVEYQEPSAFPRRNKTRNRRHLENITNLHIYAIDKIIKKFKAKGNIPKVYVPIISKELEEGYKILSVKDDPTVLEKITNLGLFIFSDRDVAEKFSVLIYDYFIGDIKNCKRGQRFWPEFRVATQKAINYMAMEKIHKTRNSIDKAYRNIDDFKISKERQREFKEPLKGKKQLIYVK